MKPLIAFAVVLDMIEKISLRVFWIFMLLCASCALGSIWLGGLIPGKLIPTCFIIGAASFFIWVPLTVYRFLQK